MATRKPGKLPDRRRARGCCTERRSAKSSRAGEAFPFHWGRPFDHKDRRPLAVRRRRSAACRGEPESELEPEQASASASAAEFASTAEPVLALGAAWWAL